MHHFQVDTQGATKCITIIYFAGPHSLTFRSLPVFTTLNNPLMHILMSNTSFLI